MSRTRSNLDYVSVMLAMILASLLFSLWNASFWHLRRIEITGTSPYTRSDLERYLKKYPLQGTHALALNPLKLQSQLRQNPLIRDVQIEREFFPSQLTLRVQERKPAYLLYRQEAPSDPQKAFVIDHEGRILPLPAKTVPDGGVLVSIQSKWVKAQLSNKHQDTLRMLEALWTQKLIPIRGLYDISDPNNLILHQEKPRLTVWLGKTDQLPLKLKLISATLESSQLDPSQILYLDLRSWQDPVIKTRS